MGSSQKKKELGKKKYKKSPLTGTQGLWVQKRPVVLFLLGFVVLIILFYVFWTSYFYKHQIEPQLLSLYAKISGFLLTLSGIETRTTGEALCSATFSFSVVRGCDGIEAMALFVSALLVFPAKWLHKLKGLIFGVAILFAINLLRIISLFLTGIYFPKAFEFMHVEFWQVFFILLAIGLWLFWIKWSGKEGADVAK